MASFLRLRRRVALAVALVAAASAAHAAAAQDRSHAFDIGAQDAVVSLQMFGRQAGKQVLFPFDTVAGKRTPAVRGVMTDREALARLAAGAGLVVVSDDGHTVVLRPLRREANRPQPKIPPGGAPPSSGADPVQVAEAIAPSAVDEVIVTGTRIALFDAPTPVTSLGKAELQANGARNLADLVADIPALQQNRNVGQALRPLGSAQIDLRGLNGQTAAQRTLVMIDGRRVSPTAYNGWVDANIIPVHLIKRLEVVTGGASAAYGSDAVAGVVNFILDRDFEGLKGDVSYGQSTYGDARQPGVSAAWGRSFAGGKAHVVASGEYFSDSGVLSQNQRPWGREGWCVNTNSRNGVAFTFFRRDCKYSQLTLGGVTPINAPAPIRNIQFGPGGVVLPFNRGAEVGAQFMTGGDGFIADTATIATKTKRTSAFAAFTYEVDERLQVFADALYSKVSIFANSGVANDSVTSSMAALIRPDNAFLPASVRDAMLADNIASFRLGRTYGEEGWPYSNVGAEHQRYTFGLRGALGKDWTWEGFVAVARTDYDTHTHTMRNLAKFDQAVDSVIDPATGQAVCRANLGVVTAPGCVPLNPFGPGSVTPAAMAWYLGTAFEEDDIQEDVAGLTLRGAPLTLPAGKLGLAFGVEARRDEIVRVGDPISQVNGWRTTNFGSFGGEVKVKEAFGEIAIPLLADLPWAKKLDVDFAARVTDYSTSGTVATWKAGANYAPTGWLRLRGTISRDIRAPTIYEAFRPAGIQTFVTVLDPRLGGSTQAPQITGGNPQLRPEVARTHTAGFVVTPDSVPGLRASVDYYKIDIGDVITTLTPQQTVDQCEVARNLQYCDLIVRGAGGAITSIGGQDMNAASLRTAGIDTEVQYRFPLETLLPIEGDVTLRMLATYTQYRITTASGVATDIAGQNNAGIPTWKINASAAYARGPLNLRATVRFISAGKYNKTLEEGVRIEDNSLPSATYVDLSAAYQIDERFQLYGAVNNLFNEAPPVSPSAIVEVQYNAAGNYDTIGRWATVGLRFSF